MELGLIYRFCWFTAGNTYYVVVDGYGGDAGNYQLDVL